MEKSEMETGQSGAGAASPGEVAREFLEEVLEALEIGDGVQVERMDDGTWHLEVVGENAGEVIGRYGDTINALQYLATLVTARRSGEQVRLLLDAEGYRARREAALVEQAQTLADEVEKAGQEAELDPLNPYERRIIHNSLLDHPGVITYSEGAEPERRVIIAPRPKS